MDSNFFITKIARFNQCTMPHIIPHIGVAVANGAKRNRLIRLGRQRRQFPEHLVGIWVLIWPVIGRDGFGSRTAHRIHQPCRRPSFRSRRNADGVSWLAVFHCITERFGRVGRSVRLVEHGHVALAEAFDTEITARVYVVVKQYEAGFLQCEHPRHVLNVSSD